MLEEGYYSSYKNFEDKSWFKGTCLEKVHEKFPDLKIEMFSEEAKKDGLEISEDLINEIIYTKLPSWYTPLEENTQYFFEWSI
ncbi:hypothetical protein [Peptoniphilus harei]|uniref:Uncharacterized protein n=1 Tax=Peptoniphilus harei TaxID=54005 RepID=A0A943SS86_9FIRM|nr:hypothetical protein [Peptoniphilus harei]MBS6535842.1 hypothetical protein [Peptoniphilus harei]